MVYDPNKLINIAYETIRNIDNYLDVSRLNKKYNYAFNFLARP